MATISKIKLPNINEPYILKDSVANENLNIHKTDSNIHITEEERIKWNNMDIPITSNPDSSIDIWIDPDDDEGSTSAIDSYYTKEEMDILLDDKADTSNAVPVVLEPTDETTVWIDPNDEIDNSILSTYTKLEIDAKFEEIMNYIKSLHNL